MSQSKIIELLKQNPKGLTAQELHEYLGTTNCYGQLKKLERSGEIVQYYGRFSRWKINE